MNKILIISTVGVLTVLLFAGGIGLGVLVDRSSEPSDDPIGTVKDGVNDANLEDVLVNDDVIGEKSVPAAGDIAWLDEPQGVDGITALESFAEAKLVGAEMYYKADSFQVRGNGENALFCTGVDCLSGVFEWRNERTVYKMGDFADGKYGGGELYFVDQYGGGPCGPCARYRMALMPDGTLTMLTQYSNDSPNFKRSPWREDYFAKFIEIDETYEISELHPPTEILIPESKIRLIPKDTPHYLFAEWSKGPDILFEDPVWGPVYQQFRPDSSTTQLKKISEADIGIRLVDGSVFQYEIDTSFIMSDDSDGEFYALGVGKRGALTASYVETGAPVASGQQFNSASGQVCGGGTVGQRVNNRIVLDDSFPQARTPSGEIVYVLNFDNWYASDLFSNKYIGYRIQNPDATYEEFLSIVPAVYWVDPFGRVVEFINNDSMSGAECGGGTPKSPLTPR